MLRDTAACKSSTNYVYDFGGKNLVSVVDGGLRSVGKVGWGENAAKEWLRMSGCPSHGSDLGIREIGSFFHWVPSIFS